MQAYAEALHHASLALSVLYDWATAWDKRMAWAQWIGFSRMLVLRASRKLQGLPSLPTKQLAPEAVAAATKVTFLQDLSLGFERTTTKTSEEDAVVSSVEMAKL